MFLGIDLTSSTKKPSAWSLLDEDGSLLDLGSCRTDEDILCLCRRQRPRSVAIDAPLGLPRGMCCLEESCSCQAQHLKKGRECERELSRRGIPLYFTTKRSIIKDMVYRAIVLARDLRADGYEVIEVYPYASKVMLFGRPIPPKAKKEGLEFLRGHLSYLIVGARERAGELDHDLCDALIAAHTGFLHSRGLTEALGLEDEAQIVVPVWLEKAAR